MLLAVCGVRFGRTRLVVEHLDVAGRVCELVHAPEQPERPLPAHEDVHPAVVHPVDQLRDASGAADLREPFVAQPDDAELGGLLEAQVDHPLVALLEDVQRRELGRQQHERQREDREALVSVPHALRLPTCRCAVRWIKWSPIGRSARCTSCSASSVSSGWSSSPRTKERSARCPAAVAAFEAAAGSLNRYPDAGGMRLREELARRHKLPLEQVVLGNGADELIRLCAVATLDAATALCCRGRRFRATSYRLRAPARSPSRSRSRAAGSTSTGCSARRTTGRSSSTCRTRTTPPASCSTAPTCAVCSTRSRRTF